MVKLSLPATTAAGASVRGLVRVPGTQRVRVVVQERRRGRWVTVGSRSGSRRVAVRLRVRTRAGQARYRARVLRGGRLTGRSRTAVVRVQPRVKGASAPSVFTLPSADLRSAPRPGKSGTLRLREQAPASRGDVVAMGVTDATPYGYLGRVTEVGQSGRLLTVRPERITDVIPQGSFSVTAKPETPQAKSSQFTRAINNLIKCSSGARLTATGSLEFIPSIDFSYRWGRFKPEFAELTGSVEAKASVSAEVTGKATCGFPPTQIPGVAITLRPITVVVAGIPIVLVPKVEADASAQATVEAAVKTSATASYKLTAGVRWDRGTIIPIRRGEPRFDYQPPTLTAKGTISANVIPKFSILVYGVAGPQARISAGLKLTADPFANPWWKLTAPVKITGVLTAPDLKLSTPELTIYSREFPLRDAGGPLSGGGGTGGAAGGGGSNVPGSGDPSPGPGAYAKVTPLAPTTGPAGYKFFLAGPTCAAQAGETAVVRADAPAPNYSSEALNGTGTISGWWLDIGMQGPAGSYVASVSCLGVSSGGRRVIWSEEVPFSVSGPAPQVKLAGTPSKAEGYAVFRTGATRGTAPCPDVPGLVADYLELYVAPVVGGAPDSFRGIGLPTATTTESVPLPANLDAGQSGVGFAACRYGMPGVFGIRALIWFEPAEFTVAP